MKAPDFWQSKHSIFRWLLLPLSWIYYIGHLIKFHSKASKKVNIPVLCVGNITVGGTGKTPTVALLTHLLHAQGKHPHIISRGYSGSIHNTTQVQSFHIAREVGDEILLLAQYAPCWIGCDRVASAQAAQQEGADIIIMDDGFQNPSLYKDASMIVIDGKVGFGNETLLPAGCLREPIASALKRVNMVLIIGEDRHHLIPQIQLHNIAVIQADINADYSQIKKQRLVAFCGIGRPQKFYDTLKKAHYNIMHTQNFADHHHFSDNELQLLQQLACTYNAQLVTTEKDWFRLSAAWKEQIAYVPIKLKTDNIVLSTWLQNIHSPIDI